MKKIWFVILLFTTLLWGSGMAAAPKYVFFFIGDGMGIGHVQSLRTYYKDTSDPEGNLQHFYDFPIASIVTTFSYDDDMTDSAAAGTALACSKKTRNSMLGMDADTVALTSVAKRMKQAGRGVGIMSSVCLNDATPAAFYASRPNRGDYYEIALQGACSGFDFLAGAYFRDPYGTKAGTPGNVFTEYQNAGYTIVRGKQGYEDATAAHADRILWLDADTVSENTIGYAIDGCSNDMTLPNMVSAAIEHLYKNYRKGFFIMAEGGGIDHLAHANDAAGVIRETKEFDTAIRVAYEFYRQHPKETLIIVTADHETGGLGLGVKESSYKQHMDYIQHVSVSKNAFWNEFCKSINNDPNNLTWENAERFINKRLGLGSIIPLSAGEKGTLMTVFQKSVIDKTTGKEHTLYADFDGFTTAVYKLLSTKIGIGWTTYSHTGNAVPFFAIGAGADHFATAGWLDNTDLSHIISQLCRLQ